MCLFRTHCKLQNYDTALDIIDQLLDQDVSKQKAEYHLEKSDLLLKLGRNDEADAVCEAAIKLYPKNIKLLTLYARVGQRKLNAA
jgi:pentatricopeptide repeat protein